ncbi:MAG: hypothetical protein E7307_01435 [Butyrivibrio sp.]|nr:hypothetical protein [Butyrivibrio sp.]
MKVTKRFERRLESAREESIEVLMTYEREIELQKTRQRATKNGFVWQCCQQEIDQLTAEMDAIDLEVNG